MNPADLKMPSLEQMAIITSAIALWNQEDIRSSLANVPLPVLSERSRKIWQELEDKVTVKLQYLSQPKAFKEKIHSFIKIIGLGILKWLEYHKHCCDSLELPTQLCWSPHGTINGKRTAEMLINDENIDITIRYKLACIYCLDTHISELWKNIPANQQQLWYKRKEPREQNELVAFWTYSMNGEVAKWNKSIEKRLLENCTPYENAFAYAAIADNKEATEYFLNKLAPVERRHALEIFTGHVINFYDRSFDDARKQCRVLEFLFPQLDENQQNLVLQFCSSVVLHRLLDWPYQDLFLETATRMLNGIYCDDCQYLSVDIIDKVIEGFKDYDYQNLFGEFWQRIPLDCRIYNIKNYSGMILTKLFQAEDKKNVKLILNDATIRDKVDIILSDEGFKVCESLIYGDKSELLNFFLQECISDKDTMIEFDEKFRKYMIHRRKNRVERYLWRNNYCQMLEGLIGKWEGM